MFHVFFVRSGPPHPRATQHRPECGAVQIPVLVLKERRLRLPWRGLLHHAVMSDRSLMQADGDSPVAPFVPLLGQPLIRVYRYREAAHDAFAESCLLSRRNAGLVRGGCGCLGHAAGTPGDSGHMKTPGGPTPGVRESLPISPVPERSRRWRSQRHRVRNRLCPNKLQPSRP